MERSSTWSSGLTILRANQRANRKKIFWINVSLIIITYISCQYLAQVGE